MAGFTTDILVRDCDRGLAPYYQLAGARQVHAESDCAVDAGDVERRAAAILRNSHSLNDLLAVTVDGIQVGRVALSTGIRQRHIGKYDLGLDADRNDILPRLVRTLSVVDQSQALIDKVSPQLVLFLATEYTPTAELFDVVLSRGIEAVAYDAGHRAGTLIFKRYSNNNRVDHLTTLSAETREELKRMDWSQAHSAALDLELAASYQTGDWYRAYWTQAHAREADAVEIRGRLGLRPNRKTAFIFSHILWDAPLSWGPTLFTTYEEWLVETVRAACKNDRLDWVIKIHPANIGKRLKEGFTDEPAEVRVIRERIGTLPPHVKMLEPSFEISTASIFGVMDYCLTVRGTVGIEAARLGIPTVVAGKGRYGSLGFTIDSDTVDEYRALLGRLEEVPPLHPGSRNLAERYAYGFFLMKPFRMTSVSWDYGNPGDATTATINLTDAADWARAEDIRRLADWFADGRTEDLLSPPPGFVPVSIAGSGGVPSAGARVVAANT